MKNTSGAVDTEMKVPVISISDEAMDLEFFFENYREKWLNQFEMRARGEKPGGRVRWKIHTSSTIGHAELYSGLSKKHQKYPMTFLTHFRQLANDEVSINLYPSMNI